MAKQHCVCALKALRDQRLEKGLDPPPWMQVVKVNLLKTETSWATRVAIAGSRPSICTYPPCHRREQLATSLCICDIRRLGLTRLQGNTFTEPSRKWRAEVLGFRHKFPTTNSRYVPLSNARPRNPNMATHPPHVQSYSVKAFGRFFTWVYHAEDVAVTLLDNFEKMGRPVTMNQLKFLQCLYEPSLLQWVAADMSRPKTNIKEIQDRASAYSSKRSLPHLSTRA